MKSSPALRSAFALALPLALSLALSLAILLGLSACQPPPPPFQAKASIQDLMVSIVDPSADALWESVSTETSAAGTVEKQPRTEEEWQAVRRLAIRLQEAGNLLMIEGRPVTHGGQKTEDAHVEGVSSAPQIKLAIDGNRPAFNASARLLHDAAAEAVLAIDRKDPARLLLAGARLDQAGEHCHSVYWYPNAKLPSAKWPAPLKAQ